MARRPLVARFQTICRICASSARHQTGSGGTSQWIECALDQLGTVLQQRAGIGDDLPHVEPRQRAPLRLGVCQKAPDRLVQSIGLAQHDVHQLRLLVAQRQFLPQDLERARHRCQRIPDLVGDARGHLPDRRQTVLYPRLALLTTGFRDVLEGEHEPDFASRRPQDGRADAEHDLASIRALEAGTRRAAASCAPRASRTSR